MAEQLVSPKVEALAQELAADPELNDGLHLLVLAEGDCETLALCTCGQDLGNYRADVSADLIVDRWQRHAMGLSS